MWGERGVHCDELFEFGASVDDAVMRTKDEFEEFSDGPRDDALGI